MKVGPQLSVPRPAPAWAEACSVPAEEPRGRRTENWGRAGGEWRGPEGLTCEAAAVSPPSCCRLQEEGEVGNACAASAPLLRPPHAHAPLRLSLFSSPHARTPHFHFASSLTHSRLRASSELTATPSSPLDLKARAGCSQRCLASVRRARGGLAHMRSRPIWVLHPWARHVASLGLSFPICRIGRMIPA